MQADDNGWGGFDDSWPVESLVSNLIKTDKVEAIHALRTDLRKKTLYLRWHVLETVGEVGFDPKKNKVPEEVDRAIDQLLVQALDDTEECDRTIRWQGKEVTHGSVGDLAATLLAKRWQRPQDFDAGADFRTRRQQRIVLGNVWRKQQGLALLPVPPRLKIEPAAENEMAPLLAAVTKDSDRAKALADLEAIGLPALPGVKTLLASLPKEQPVHQDVQQLAGRLRTMVQEVSFAPDTVPPTPELRRQFEAWKGKRVTPLLLEEAVLSTLEKLPPDAFGIDVALEHPGDTTGVTMMVTLAEKRPLFSRGKGKNWVSYQRLVLDGKVVHAISVGTYKGFQCSDFKEFGDRLETILNSPPDRSISVRFGLAVDMK